MCIFADMDETIAYLHRVLRETNTTASQLAAQAGVASSTLTRPLNEDWPHGLSRRTVDKIQAVTGIPFKTDVVPTALPVTPSADQRFVTVPRYRKALSAGSGVAYNEKYSIDAIPFTREFVRAKLGRESVDDLCIMEASGNSMSPVISSGDIVLVDIKDQSPSGEIMGFIHNGNAYVKRVSTSADDYIISSDNSAMSIPTYTIPHKEDAFEIIGRVIWVGKVL